MSQPDAEGDNEPLDEIELGNGDTLKERIEAVNLEADETVSTEELRERFHLAE